MERILLSLQVRFTFRCSHLSSDFTEREGGAGVGGGAGGGGGGGGKLAVPVGKADDERLRRRALRRIDSRALCDARKNKK